MSMEKRKRNNQYLYNYPLRPRFAMANKKAEELLESIGNPELPIPLDQLCELYNWEVVYTNLNGPDGQMMKVPHEGDTHFVIFVATDMDVTTHGEEVIRRRQLWTIAHEIGHILLHADFNLESIDDMSRLTDEAKAIMEVEANWLASRLLIPDYAFMGLDDLDVEMLAEKCQVNYQASLKRITGLSGQVRAQVIRNIRKDIFALPQAAEIEHYEQPFEEIGLYDNPIWRSINEVATGSGFEEFNIAEWAVMEQTDGYLATCSDCENATPDPDAEWFLVCSSCGQLHLNPEICNP
jgi:hypothetical protein